MVGLPRGEIDPGFIFMWIKDGPIFILGPLGSRHSVIALSRPERV